MIATLERPAPPSTQKYGTIITEDGFTQHPRAVEDYLNSLKALCSTEILLIIILSSYRWTAEQESYPSVRTLAERCGVSARRVNQMTAHLVKLGLLVKVERFSARSQISNYYDLEPLYHKVAAWKNAEVAAALAEEEAHADEPFEPQDILEKAAQALSEEYGEPEPRQQRYNVLRLARRWEQHPKLDWETFTDVVEKAAEQTEARAKEPTRTGRVFAKLVPYFFSALDYWLSKISPAPEPEQKITTQSQANQKQICQEPRPAEQQRGQSKDQPRNKGQQPKKSGVLAERARARKEAEANGKRKVRTPETLKLRIEAAALTFRDKAVKSSVQRAANLMADAQLDELTMCELVAEARAAASAACNVKNRMPYFFTILEDLVGKSTDISIL